MDLETRRTLTEVRREVDRICSMIVTSCYEDVDIAIARSELRWKVAESLPDRLDFYDMVYESRFERLWGQFREHDRAGNDRGLR